MSVCRIGLFIRLLNVATIAFGLDSSSGSVLDLSTCLLQNSFFSFEAHHGQSKVGEQRLEKGERTPGVFGREEEVM